LTVAAVAVLTTTETSFEVTSAPEAAAVARAAVE